MALTVGGTESRHPPHRCDAGPDHENRCAFVDATAGHRGVVDPAGPLPASSIAFSLRARLPAGVFDDDISFGIRLRRLGGPLYALPGPFGRSRFGAAAGDSAVAVDRMTNGSTLFTHVVESELIVPAARRSKAPPGVWRRMRLRYERLRTAFAPVMRSPPRRTQAVVGA